MGWFKRKKEKKKHTEPNKKLSSLGEPISDDLGDKVDYEIYTGKIETYSVPGVDEVIYSKTRVKDRIKREYSKQLSSYICPKCKIPLQNVKKDGVHFNCTNYFMELIKKMRSMFVSAIWIKKRKEERV